MSKYTQLARNTILVFGGGIGSKLITLFMMPLYTRWLSVDGYGTMDLITIYVTLLVSIVSFCIPEALFVFPCGESKDKQKGFFTSGLVFNFGTVILAFIVFSTLYILSNNYSWNNSFTDNIWLIYIMLITTILQQQVQQFTRSTNHMIVYSLTGLVYTLCVLIMSFYFVKQYGVSGYVLCITLANVISAIYCFIFSKIYEYISISSYNIEFIKEMLKYSIPLIPNSIMWWLVNALNRPVMEGELGMHDVGIYAVASRFPAVLSVLFTMFTASWQISAIEEFKSEGYSVFYNRIFKLSFNVLVCILMGIALSSKLLVGIFADVDFYDAWMYIPILTLATFISCMSAFVGVNFSASRTSKYFLYSSLFGALASICLNFMLIPVLKMWGACIAVLMSFGIIAILRIYYSKKFVQIEDRIYYIIMLLGVTIIIISYTLNYQLLSYFISLVVLLYLIIANRNELHMIRNKIVSLISKE